MAFQRVTDVAPVVDELRRGNAQTRWFALASLCVSVAALVVALVR